MKEQVLTLEQFMKNDLYCSIQHAQSLYPKYPDKPKKPSSLPLKHNHNDILQYADNYKAYELNLIQYKKEKQEYDLIVGEINNIIELGIKDTAGLNTIPEKYQDKMWNKAWDLGHSSGYYEVYNQLISLLEIFD